MAPLRGWGPKGVRLRGFTPHGHWRTLTFVGALREWLYAKPYNQSADRAADRQNWLHWYNHHRPHAALKARSPASALNNLLGNDI